MKWWSSSNHGSAWSPVFRKLFNEESMGATKLLLFGMVRTVPNTCFMIYARRSDSWITFLYPWRLLFTRARETTSVWAFHVYPCRLIGIELSLHLTNIFFDLFSL
jgi:hypothetical protein